MILSHQGSYTELLIFVKEDPIFNRRRLQGMVVAVSCCMMFGHPTIDQGRG